jgi:glucose/arabinose dehydrogenase
MAVHPKFAQNRKFYVYYSAPLRASAPTNFDHSSHISEFTLAADDTARNERLLLAFDLPYFNHHGGRMAFGPDDSLYIGVGDGGNRDDTGKGHSEQGNAQDTTKLLGKILRINVDHKNAGEEYAVPKDNPFANAGNGAPEIFAYGFRNPWGLSFDRGGKHELFVTDVGQESWEELDIVVKGGNYGWRLREGFVCFDPRKPKNPPEDCPKIGANGEPLIDPILAYKNFGKFTRDPEARGVSITGGYVYRGKALPQLAGKYVFADWSRSFVKPDGVIYVGTKSGDKWTMDTLDLASHANGGVGNYVVALGEDADGELYVLTNTSNLLKGKNGKVWKLVAQ